MNSTSRVVTALVQASFCIWIGLAAATAGAFSRVLVIPWGEGDSRVAHRWCPGGRYGPGDFVIAPIGPESSAGSFLYLLDRVQQRIQCFDLTARTYVASSPVPPASERLAIKPVQGEERPLLAVWDGNTLYTGHWGEPLTVLKRVGPVARVKQLDWRGDQLVIVGYDGSRRLAGATGPELVQPPRYDGDELRIDRVGRSGLALSQGAEELLQVELERDLGVVQYLGSIAGRHLVLTEEILSHSPIMARELLLVLNSDGQPQRIVPIPFLYFTYLPERFRLVGSMLFVWVSAPSGLHLLAADAEAIGDDRLHLPVFAEEPYHYNHHHPPPPPAEWVTATTAPISAEEEISRQTIMEIADSFATVEWTATMANTTRLGRSPIYCPHGDHLIRTPEWVTPGPKVSMPYKWGGFTDVETFLAGVPAGKYCGDDYCSRTFPYHACFGDTYTLGVDCSGFVSRCWGLRNKYSTSTLVSISRPLTSVHDLLPGDCLNLAGIHVRLIAENNPTGPLLIVEAGAEWRVGYFTFVFTDLNGYIPRRFLWVTEDTDGPRPRSPGGRRTPLP